MSMTRKEFLAGAAAVVGAQSACAGKVIVLAAVAFLALSGNCGTRYWLPRSNSLRAVTNGTDTSTLTLTALGAVQRDLSFLPSAKEKGPITHVVCSKVAMAEMRPPYDEELDYLEANGNQHIITDIIPRSDRGIIVEFAYTGYASGYGRMFGTQKDGIIGKTLTIRQSTSSSGGIYIEIGHASAVYSFDLNKHILTANNPVGTFLFDSTTISGASIGAIKYPCWIFGNNGVSSGFAKGRIYRVNEVSNSNVITDLIPVLKNGVPCMYDKIGGGFYYNQVSGHQFGYKKKDGTIVSPY